MKKILSTILASSMLLSTLAMTVTAQEITTGTEETAVYTATLTASESDFTFVSGVITEYTGSGGNVVIPSTIGGQAVTSIGTKAFLNNTTVESITMPSSLERIEATAFEGCSNLRSVELNEGLEFLGFNSFGRTTNLSKIWIPSTVTEMEQGVFYESGLTSAYIPETVRQVGPYIFDKCTRLRSVTFMANVDALPTGTFRDCYVLEDVYLREGIKNIGAYAFQFCSALKEINLPSTLQSIGENAFYSCYKLSKLDFSNTQLTSVELGAFQFCHSLEEAIFPYGFQKFAYGVNYMYTDKAQFYGCTSLKRVVLPSTVNDCYWHYSIPNYSVGLALNYLTNNWELLNHPFVNCKPSLVVESYGSNTVAKMASYTNTFSLSTLSGENTSGSTTPIPTPTLPTKADMTVKTVTAIPTPNASAESDFVLGDGGIITRYTGAGGDVAIPSTIGGQTVNGIGANAFLNNTSIESVTTPNTLQRIEQSAFEGCSNLRTLTLNEGLVFLGMNSFGRTTNLKQMWIPSTVEEMGQGVFYESGLTSAYIPETVIITGPYIFDKCTSLTSAIFMATVPGLPTGTFRNCSALEDVYICEYPTFLGGSAFRDCSSLQQITLPSTTVHISEYTFYGCSKLQKMDMTNTKLYRVDPYAFQYCTSLTEVIFPYGFCSFPYGDSDMDKNKGQFRGCTSLTKVVLPSSLETCYHYQNLVVMEIFNHPFRETNASLVIYSYSGTAGEALANMTSAIGFSSLGDISTENKNPTLIPTTVPTLPTAPTTASTPTVTPTTPQVDSNTKTATPSDVKVMVNGSVVGFAPYSIDGFNYFKLTDMAFAIDGTGKQFEVKWDAEKSAINMVTGSAHKHLGNEMEGNSGKSEVAERFTSTVYKNGEAIDVLVYTIDGSSYFQLDTLKSVLGIDVGWDGATGTITITT